MLLIILRKKKKNLIAQISKCQVFLFISHQVNDGASFFKIIF